jgi:hypothetical protein
MSPDDLVIGLFDEIVQARTGQPALQCLEIGCRKKGVTKGSELYDKDLTDTL